MFKINSHSYTNLYKICKVTQNNANIFFFALALFVQDCIFSILFFSLLSVDISFNYKFFNLALSNIVLFFLFKSSIFFVLLFFFDISSISFISIFSEVSKKFLLFYTNEIYFFKLQLFDYSFYAAYELVDYAEF